MNELVNGSLKNWRFASQSKTVKSHICLGFAIEEWEDVAFDTGGFRTEGLVYSQTGYLPTSLSVLWASARPFFDQYRDGYGALVQRIRELWRPQHYFYIFLKFLEPSPLSTVLGDFSSL